MSNPFAGELTPGTVTQPPSFRFFAPLRVITAPSSSSNLETVRPFAFVAAPPSRTVYISPISLHLLAPVTAAAGGAYSPIYSPISAVDLNGPSSPFSPTSPVSQSIDENNTVRYSPCSPTVEQKHWLATHTKSMPASGHYLKHPYRFADSDMQD